MVVHAEVHAGACDAHCSRLHEDGRLETLVGRGRWCFVRHVSRREYDLMWAGLPTVPGTEFKA